LRYETPRVTDVARKNDSAISQEAADLASQRRAVTDQALARSMKSLHVLLLNRTLRHETHVWLLNCYTDRLSIAAIVLLIAPERLHVLRADDPHLVAKAFELARPIIGAITRFSGVCDRSRN
jgi:hypothetical protein